MFDRIRLLVHKLLDFKRSGGIARGKDIPPDRIIQM
jgi:hypothetical protein